MKIFQWVLVTVGISIIACKKSDIDSNRIDNIVIGDYSNMHINHFDTVLYAFQNASDFDIDIDNDGISDFRVESDAGCSHCIGDPPKSTFSSLNSNCMIYGIVKNDTTFYHHTSTIEIVDGNSVMVYNDFIHSLNQRTSSNDSIEKVTPGQFSFIPQRKNESLRKSGTFKSDEIVISNILYSYVKTNLVNDTLIYNSYSYFNVYNALVDNIFFIGVKLNGGTQEKLGWIKLMIKNNRSIAIFESAIQE